MEEDDPHMAIDGDQRLVSDWWISVLTPLGFDLDKPVFTVKRKFDRNDLQDALFSSTFASRIPIEVEIDGTDRAVAVVVDCVRAVFPDDFGTSLEGTSLGPGPHPDWYVEGHMPIDQLRPEVVNFRMYLGSDFSDGSISDEYASFFQLA